MRVIGGLFFLLAALLALTAAARAEFFVAPLRQVITAKDPVARYRVSNASDRIVEARIDWLDLSATPEGYALATTAVRPGLSAAPYLVVTPSRLRLEPGGHAEVVVRLKKGAAIPAGERRSHLLIETAPMRTPLRRASTGLEVDVGLGISTPVILRGGFSAPTLSFESSRLSRDADGHLVFETTLKSGGRYSAYGSITAVLERQGRTTLLARIDNVAVYPDSGARRLSLPLRREVLPEGKLRLEFRSDGQDRATLSKIFEVAPAPPAASAAKVNADR
ncbi:MAG: hypothetical protein U5J99_02450 [Parvularculaceae bacterium]|nr:hypothetical protein [Parvularculaceae bacterium]